MAIITGHKVVELFWSAPSDDGGIPIIEYNIYRSVTIGTNFTYLGSSDTYSYVDTAVLDVLNYDITYYYKVTAVNIVGESEASVEISVNFSPPDLNSPDDINYELGSTSNEITWIVGNQSLAMYNVTLDGSLYVPDTQWSEEIIMVNIDGLETGEHIFIIYVYNYFGTLASDTVVVTVTASSGIKTETSNAETTETTVTTSIGEPSLDFPLFSVFFMSFVSIIMILRLRKK